MDKLSIGKLGGVCYLLGGILAFVPFAMQILVGGPPEEGQHIFTHFASNILLGGKISLLYALSSAVGIALLAYATYVLNALLQKKSAHALMSLGAFLFILAQVGLIVAWSYDLVILFAGEAVNIGHLFMVEMSLFFTFGTIGFIGGALYTLALAHRNYIYPLFLKACSLIYGITALVFVYTLVTLSPHSAATILLMFACVSISQIVSIVLHVLLGRKMMTDVDHHHY